MTDYNVPTFYCPLCHQILEVGERVIYSARETFVFKPAHEVDPPVIRKNKYGHEMEVSAAAVLSPEALAKSREEYKRTAVVNVFVDWGKAAMQEGAFNFRHQWCEPQRTGSGPMGLHATSKHSVRWTRTAARRING